MSRPLIEKGMFLKGGMFPARTLAFDNSVLITRAHQPVDEPPPSLDEIKIRLQKVREAISFIRSEKIETRDEWLKRMEDW